MDAINIFWFRRDLRLEDNLGWIQATQFSKPILPIFIFDRNILSQLDSPYDRRVDYIHQALTHLQEKHSIEISSFFDTPLNVFNFLLQEYKIDKVFFNRDYEPYAKKRDQEIIDLLKQHHIEVFHFKDHVIFEKNEVLKADESPYTIYTPYSKKWKELYGSLNKESPKMKNFTCIPPKRPLHLLSEIGFQKTDYQFQPPAINENILVEYEKKRDYPAENATSHVGVALRFGTISIRECVDKAYRYSSVWLNELIWREFFMQILDHFPSVINHAFKPKYDLIEWENDEKKFEKWSRGETGYLLVDAGMRELNATGFMHNRVRMIVASFLCKHLLIDWRWGEVYFASKLLDYELSSNNGNWQWAAGVGCDAAPYFRIFNPTAQQQKFDPQMKYIKKWLGDPLEHLTKNPPIVIHEKARERALAAYKKAIQ